MKSAERSRFDAAHELGHLVLHRHGQPSGREAEKEADAFASAFLMPRSSILAYAPPIPTIENLIEAKQFWRVSLSALAHRMHGVGRMSDWIYRSLAIEVQRLGYRKSEPASTTREQSQVLEKVFAALRKDGMSKSDIARSLAWPTSELRAMVFQLIVESQTGGGLKEPAKPRPTPPQHLVRHLRLG
jgi:Zn-dependent peptidase ImmA (M78 family)